MIIITERLRERGILILQRVLVVSVTLQEFVTLEIQGGAVVESARELDLRVRHLEDEAIGNWRGHERGKEMASKC